MSYKSGDLVVALGCPKPDEDGYCECTPEHETMPTYDSRNDDYKQPGRGVYLPHSCDSWVIGGPTEILALIADLQAALSALGFSA